MKIVLVSKLFVINAQGELLVLRRSQESKSRPLEWDLPGGHVEEGESPLDAAVRETAEEAGIALNASELQLAYAMTEPASESKSVTWLFYIAQIDDGEILLSHEHVEYAWQQPHDALNMFTYERQIRGLKYVTDHKLLPVHG